MPKKHIMHPGESHSTITRMLVGALVLMEAPKSLRTKAASFGWKYLSENPYFKCGCLSTSVKCVASET